MDNEGNKAFASSVTTIKINETLISKERISSMQMLQLLNGWLWYQIKEQKHLPVL